MPVQVVPYDPEWPRQFQQIKTELETLLDGVDIVSIEHVGSTSVPGLAAKPIIDIDIIATNDQLQPAISALQRGNLLYMGELGIQDRHAFRSPFESPSRNLYICIQDCAALRNHLSVRDLLRRDPELRKEYGDLKLEIASENLEIHGYMAKKNAMVLRLLELSGGVSNEELEDIRRANFPRERLEPIKTERLLLREFVIGDTNGLSELESAPRNVSHQDWPSRTMEEVQNMAVEIIQNANKIPREHFELAVLLRYPPNSADHQLIGRVGAKVIRPIDASSNSVFSLHFFFHPEFHRQGFATEAMRAFFPPLLATINEKIAGNRLEIECDLRNIPGCKLAERLEFIKAKIEKEGRAVYEMEINRRT